jgi:hypothetical protein
MADNLWVECRAGRSERATPVSRRSWESGSPGAGPAQAIARRGRRPIAKIGTGSNSVNVAVLHSGAGPHPDMNSAGGTL